MNTWKNTYFGSCNGFMGFRSYFDKIFDRRLFKKLYILKGGPGTGKSTLMKSIADFAQNNNLSIDRIYCSSDKDSLDAVIITSGKLRVGIVDGTAPHIVDPEHPGVVDEIINLGTYWENSALSGEKEKILALGYDKKAHYKSAYSYLKLAGAIYNSRPFKSNKFPKIIDITNGRNNDIKVISSFSKDGYYRLGSQRFWHKSVNIIGDVLLAQEYIYDMIIMNYSSRLTLYVSPLDEQLLEGIYNHDTDTIYLTNLQNADTSISPSQYTDADEYYIEKYNELLYKSKEEFHLASANHFALEKLYTHAMDFEKLNILTQELTSKIEYELQDIS